jgi:hypothetical protein
VRIGEANNLLLSRSQMISDHPFGPVRRLHSSMFHRGNQHVCVYLPSKRHSVHCQTEIEASERFEFSSCGASLGFMYTYLQMDRSLLSTSKVTKIAGVVFGMPQETQTTPSLAEMVTSGLEQFSSSSTEATGSPPLPPIIPRVTPTTAGTENGLVIVNIVGNRSSPVARASSTSA